MEDIFIMENYKNPSLKGEKIYEKYILEADYGKIISSKNRKANPLIRKIMRLHLRLSPFYNDGYYFKFENMSFKFFPYRTFRMYDIPYGETNKNLKKLDKRITELENKIWDLTKGATI